jgi:hypothetical protein
MRKSGSRIVALALAASVVALASAIASHAQAPPASAGAPKLDVWDKLVTELAALAADPYVAAAVTIIQVLGAISSANFQSETTDSLREIHRKLDDIDAKLNLLINKLPEIIQRQLSEHRKKEIIHQLHAKRIVAEAIAKKYVRERGGVNPITDASDVHVLKDIGREAIELGLELNKWGGDAIIGVLQGFTLYAYTANMTGKSYVSPEDIQWQFALEGLENVQKLKLYKETEKEHSRVADNNLWGRFGVNYLEINEFPFCGVKIVSETGRKVKNSFSLHSVYCDHAPCRVAGYQFRQALEGAYVYPRLKDISVFAHLRDDARAISLSNSLLPCTRLGEMAVQIMNHWLNELIRRKEYIEKIDTMIKLNNVAIRAIIRTK